MNNQEASIFDWREIKQHEFDHVMLNDFDEVYLIGSEKIGIQLTEYWRCKTSRRAVKKVTMKHARFEECNYFICASPAQTLQKIRGQEVQEQLPLGL